MSKQANKTMIGSFVVGAVALIVTGVLIFGSGKFMQERFPHVMYFENSVKGLDVGAPVVWKGVKVGTVTDIQLNANPADLTLEIPVFIEIEPDRLKKTKAMVRERSEIIKLMIEKGLRAQLGMQSLVTGKLMIELGFHPDKPARLVGSDPDYMEIPTISSDLSELAQRIEKAPIEEILEKLHSAVSGIEKVVNSPEIMTAIQNLNGALEDTRKLVNNVDVRIEPIASDLDVTIRDARKLVQNIDNQIELLASSIKDTADAATGAVTQAEKTLITVDGSIGEGSPLTQDLSRALNELSAAVRSIRLLAEDLKRRPESLLYGKGGRK